MVCYWLDCSGGKEALGSLIASVLSTGPPPWLSKTPLLVSFCLERTRMFSKLLIGLDFHCPWLDFWIFQQKGKKLYWGIIFLSVGGGLCRSCGSSNHTTQMLQGNRRDPRFHCWLMMVTSDPWWSFLQDSGLPLWPWLILCSELKWQSFIILFYICTSRETS